MSDTKFDPGALVRFTEGKHFPVVLRDGPGYTFDRVGSANPSEVFFVMETKLGHGMSNWVLLRASTTGLVGWIPENAVMIA